MVQVANGGRRTPSGTLAHFLAADYVARPGCLRPHLKPKNSYLSPDELALARSDYLRPALSPRESAGRLAPHELAPARSEYLRAPRSPSRAAPQPRSSLSLRADSADAERCRSLRPRPPPPRACSVRAPSPPPSPPCDCLPTEPIPPPELFDF